ncbi:MAG: hypothetical protein HY092_00840 [Candidatus Kerfeldbacteria bacterium]|nr:hypothetical protein [Candidatus Kerfeldbacteria bacterium]
MKIRWPEEVIEKLKELTADTPPSYRKYIDVTAKLAGEQQAERLGRSEVDEDAMVRGYITCVPRHLRDGIEEVLSEHNIDLIYFRPVFDEPQALIHPKTKPSVPPS